MMPKLTAFWLAVCLSLVPYAALAAKYDGSVPLLCAVIEVLECEAGAECHRGNAESVNLPPFVKIDVSQKVLSTPPRPRPNNARHRSDTSSTSMAN